MSELREKKCAPCEGGSARLDAERAQQLLSQLSGRWSLDPDATRIQASFEFRNYWRTTAFVNAVVWIAHQEDHHPDISFGYKQASISYWTHAVGGLSENDFICAAKIDALLA